MKEDLLPFLAETLAAAAKELSDRFGSDIEIREKPDSSLVTDADVAAERAIVKRLQKHFPDDVIYAEESGKSTLDRQPGRGVWIIDPLDGTTNFANRYPFFCSSIGYGRFNSQGVVETLAGGIVDPVRNKTYLAAHGRGATCNGRKITVTKRTELNKSFLVTGFYYSKGDALSNEIKRFHRIAGFCSSIRRDGAAALDMALVAEGIYDGFWEMGLAPWDVAAGAVLVREAGGIVGNFKGALSEPFDPEHASVVAANPAIAREIASHL